MCFTTMSKRWSFVMISHQLMHIIVNVIVHIQVFIVMFKRRDVLHMHVDIEHQKSSQYVVFWHLIWLFITLALVMSSAHHRIGVSLSTIVTTQVNCFFQTVRERDRLAQCHSPTKAFISAWVVNLQRILNHVPYSRCGMTHENNAFMKLFDCKSSFCFV